MATKVLKQVAAKATLNWTSSLERLVAMFADPEQTYLYACTVDNSGVPHVRKLTIARDVAHARAQLKQGKALIGQYVKFSVRKGWSGDVWFNDVVSKIQPE